MRATVHRVMLLVAAVVGVTMMLPAVASAHTALESSSPADGDVVAGPVDEVTLVFIGTPTATDGGIAVADSSGGSHIPVAVVQDGLQIVATFDPPLAAGAYALAWRVRSDDTHFIDGTISFTVDATPTAAATATPTTTTSVPAATSATTPATTTPATTTPVTTTPVTTTTPATSTTTVAVVAEPAASAPVAPQLADVGDEGRSVARFGRLLLFPSAAAAIGMLAFAALAFAGRPAELATLLRGVRWLGVGVAFGAVVQVVGLSSLLGGFGQVLDEGPGRAAVARVCAGVMLVVGFGAIAGEKLPRLVERNRVAGADPRRSLSAAVMEPAVRSGSDDLGDGRWRPAALDAIGLTGLAILIVSFAFDGHTISRGPRVVHGVVSVLHVLGAGVWAGGLVALAVVLWRRHRDGVASRAVEMIVRFSVIAMAALTMTGIAGLVMALFVDADIVGYVSTEWGRLMLLKIVLVAAAAVIGAHNHFRVLPALRASPTDEDVLRNTRTTVTIEAGLVMAAAVVTALLVAASTLD